MAHIPDGILSAPVLAAGVAVTVAGCAYGLKSLTHERIPAVALLSSVCFVASLIHFPVGPTSVHLILNGLIGIALGRAAFPAILIALILQMVLFGFGGVLSLGVNVMNMAVPALICGALFQWSRRFEQEWVASFAAASVAALGVFLTACLVALTLALSGKAFMDVAQLVVVAHLPVMVIEAFFTGALVRLLLRVKPEVLAGSVEGTVHA